MKILVADDSKTTLALLGESIKKLGHEFLPASGGQEALDIFQREHPDLVILDVLMEGVNGFECAKRIRRINVSDWIPIIFLSGVVDDENVSQGINSGGDDYITKPYSEVTLAAKIKAMQRISDMRKRLFETTQKLQILSSVDALTGVCNRMQFDVILAEKLNQADRSGRMMALLFLDLDNFKTVNDHLGHHSGDLLLIEAANRLQSCLRPNDVLARLGGDEFAVILDGIDGLHSAGSVAKKIIQSFETSYNLSGNEVHSSCSIGIACYPFTETTHTTLVQNADMAMYYAKELGRNNYQYFTEELQNKRKQQLWLESELKYAVEKNEFCINYQPIFSLKTRQLVGMEALLCWNHHEAGIISPNLFISVAEETGLIFSIGKWVLKTVCAQGEQWFMKGYRNFKISVNVSARQLLREDFPAMINEIYLHTSLPIEMLEFELTETALIAYSKLSERALKKIHDLGISISLDDFGTGYSSLSHLKQLPIDTIKIDRSFVNDIGKNKDSEMIANTVISLGRNLGFNVIAEGIENDEQLQFLIKNGCAAGQGYYLGEPRSAEKMTLFLKESGVGLKQS